MASAGCALAQDKPTSEEARKVIDYYFHGKGKGVVPMEYKFCREVSQKGENKNECVAEIAANSVKKGQEAYLWMNFLVPAGEEAKILLQYSRNDMVRDTSNVSLGGATRYRTWKRIPTSTPGDWKVRLVQEMSNADLEIGQLQYSVVD
jgi:hypothetical protein